MIANGTMADKRPLQDISQELNDPEAERINKNVNFKSKQRKIGISNYFTNEETSSENKSNVMVAKNGTAFRDPVLDESEMRENAPWAFNTDSFIQTNIKKAPS